MEELHQAFISAYLPGGIDVNIEEINKMANILDQLDNLHLLNKYELGYAKNNAISNMNEALAAFQRPYDPRMSPAEYGNLLDENAEKIHTGLVSLMKLLTDVFNATERQTECQMQDKEELCNTPCSYRDGKCIFSFDQGQLNKYRTNLF